MRIVGSVLETAGLSHRAPVIHSLASGSVELSVACDSRLMDRFGDPYNRLATLLWLLKPADVARLVAVADLLAERRLADLQWPPV